MKALSPYELDEMAALMERAIKHEQLALGIMGKYTSAFSTTDLFGTISHDDSIELAIRAPALKWLWVRYAGMRGGMVKAAKTKKRNRAR